jgi:hypothetical protein
VSSSQGHLKRLSRIRRRAIPAVREAYENGLISARRADTLLYLAKREQARQLAAHLTERENRNRTALLAAGTIDTYLQERVERPVDLVELQNRIRQALESGGITRLSRLSGN